MKIDELCRNCYLVETENYTYGISYRSVVVKYDRMTEKITLGRDWNYSKTTLKHMGILLKQFSYNLNKKGIEEKLNSGEFAYYETLH